MDTDDQFMQLSSGKASPEMFANTFSDSEGEIEMEDSVCNVPTYNYSKSEEDILEKTQCYCDTGAKGRETKHLPLQVKVEKDSFMEKQDVLTMKASHSSRSEKQGMPRYDDTKDLKTLDGTSESEHSVSLTQIFKDNLRHGWELYEDDLWCMPLVHNKTNLSLSVMKGQSAKSPKNYSRRLMMNKLKKGAYRFVYMSPMAMIAKMAKQNGYDLATFMETSEFIGGPSLQLPCMQCYEQFGGKFGSGLDSMLDEMSQDRSSSNGKCLRCGGQVQTLASFGKMIRQMRDKIEDKGLIPHDVYPDGNCLFAAIVDQLRVQGDFSFTSQTLRQAAVNYLKENPTADDGTPLEMFLTDGETWSMYLTRMSEDGEWGDHMILRALASVIDRKIVIYGGTSGQSETILSPASHASHGDISESEERDSFDGQTTYLGHVSESHYISLRPKSWRQKLRKSLKQRKTSAKTLPKEEMWTTCPMNQLNFIFRQAYRMDCIQFVGSDLIDTYFPSLEWSGCKLGMFGSAVCKMVPCKDNSDSLGPDISMFFPSAKEEGDISSCFHKHVFTAFCVPNDTDIVQTMASARSVDLIAKNDAKIIGNLKLIPKYPDKWRGQTVLHEENSREITCLKGFDIDFDLPEEMIFKKIFTDESPYKFRLAFKCAWPPLASDWPRRNRETGFPDEYTIQSVINEGCHVIPLTSDTTMSDIIDDPINFLTAVDDHTWCYTFAAAEKEICRFLSAEQRKSFLVFKALIDVTLKDIPLPPSIVKSIFFYACENVEKQRWKSKPAECLLILIKKYVEGLQSRHIEHYFLEEKNLIALVPGETLEECFDRLECARRMPVVTMYFLLDQLNIMSSDIGGFVEEIIETVKADFKISTRGSITNQSLLLVRTELMENMIYQDDFQSAWLIFQDFVDEENCDLKTEGNDLLRRLLPDVNVGYIWCFALFVDIKQKSNLTSTVCNGYSCVHVTEVLGPECIEELPDTMVPECFSINSGDLYFIEKISSIMSETISGRLYIKCMKFYLKKYGEVAGDSLIIPYSASVLSMSKITTLKLQDIYVSFFNFCNANGVTEEFREMMPTYTKIAEKLGTQTCVRNLKRMWQFLGERKKAEDVSQKMGFGMEGTAFQNLVSSFLTGYELD